MCLDIVFGVGDGLFKLQSRALGFNELNNKVITFMVSRTTSLVRTATSPKMAGKGNAFGY